MPVIPSSREIVSIGQILQIVLRELAHTTQISDFILVSEASYQLINLHIWNDNEHPMGLMHCGYHDDVVGMDNVLGIGFWDWYDMRYRYY